MGKILITGTGRAGTSFLVHLLTAMDNDTGFTEQECEDTLNNECRGGLEWQIDAPYNILKNPEFSVNIEEILENNKIDHVIIPTRDLNDSAQSREFNNENHGGYGGYWLGAKSKKEMMTANTELIYNLIEALTRHDIPYTTIAFPRMVDDPKYLRNKLDGISLHTCTFNESFDKVANPEKITIK